jgi:hypothetical protein
MQRRQLVRLRRIAAAAEAAVQLADLHVLPALSAVARTTTGTVPAVVMATRRRWRVRDRPQVALRHLTRRRGGQTSRMTRSTSLGA